ncbi:hypothetical protein MOC02_18035 [Bacillus inaquosorum]|uniref:phage tail assembly chaperone G n=1 Tax=Bacillus subtilis group TaxID=653685 RepID=UPI002280EC90|nr:hypothetical protein [Bacillus inaquosorum]MCY8085114.1 hypothetical protein [Bacillus inaquosorum]MCY8126036.1 hypothetical protein [Bacillus spizizenii]
MIEITLRINGEDKEFTQDFVPLSLHKRALEVEKYASTVDSNDADEMEKLFDKRLSLITSAFDKKFTKDELKKGFNALTAKDTFYDIIYVGLLNYPTRDEVKQRETQQTDDLGKLIAKAMETNQSN